MRFTSTVEPPEPMKGLEVPPDIVAALGAGKRPRVAVTISGHQWTTRVAIMRGRNLIGLSHANREAAGVEIGEEVDVELELAPEPVAPSLAPDIADAFAADPVAQSAYDGLTVSQQRQHLRVIEAAKKPETRAKRIASAVAALHDRAR